MTPDAAHHPRARRGERPLQAPRSGRLLLLLLALTVLPDAAGAQPAAPVPRRAYVPADAPAEWPAGDWTPVPTPVLTQFLRDETPVAGRARPTAYLEQAHFRGELTDDLALEGTWGAVARRPEAARPWIELGPVSPVLSELNWSDSGAALWGADPFGRMLLLVDRPVATLSGRWSLAGREVVDQVEFRVRVPQAAATQCELALPAGWRLRSSAGQVHEPRPAEREGWLLWTIELGQHGECRWTLRQSAPASTPVLLCDRTIHYTLRPETNRLQAEFTVQTLDQVPAELAFMLPPELTNPTVTYAPATNLAARLVVDGVDRRLVVPLAGSEPGRLGTFRIAGDLPPVADADAPLPVVSLEGGVVLRGNRRIDVDRPLTLNVLELDGVRQSAVNADESGTDWFFEELRPDGRIVARVGRPQTSLTALVATHLESTADGLRFHSVVSLQARTGSTFRTTFRLPPECDVVDVFPSPNIADSGLSRWSVSPGPDDPTTLTVEFRQALHGQSPKQFEVLGRWGDAAHRAPRVPPFPVPLEADDWQMLLAIEPGREGAAAAPAGGFPRPTSAAQIPSHWAPHLQVLRLTAAKPAVTWFMADGISPSGEIQIQQSSPSERTTAPDDASAVPARTRQPAPPSPNVPPTVAMSLDLRSRISPIDSSLQLHEARYPLSGTANGARLSFELPAPAILDAVFVNERSHATEVRDRIVALAPLPTDAREILIRFRTPAAGSASWLKDRYQVPLPRWNTSVTGVRWTIRLPPGCTVARFPLDAAVGSSAPNHPWWRRAFAPWLRLPGAPLFNPLSGADWSRLLSASGAAPGPDPTVGAEVTFASLVTPSGLSLETWDSRRVGMMAQTVLFACLASGVALRRWVQRHARKAMAAGIAAALLAVLCVPDGYAPLAAGCLLGFVAAGLLPTAWVQQRDWLAAWPPRRAVLASAAGSAGLTLLCVAWPGHEPVRAQESRADGATSVPSSSAPIGTEQAAGAFDVLIPYENGEVAPVSYVEAGLRPRFTAWLLREHQLPPYLLRSVRYQVSDVDPALLRAMFDVVVLSPAARVAVVLPFRGIVFKSPDDCSVDGRPTPVRPTAAGDAFVVEVDSDRSAGLSETERPAPRRVEIAAWFRMVGGEGGGFRCGIPRVIDARLHLPAGAIGQGLRLSAVQGAQHADAQGHLDYGLGGTDWIDLAAAATEQSLSAPRSPVRADATTLVEVHPMRLQVRTLLEVSLRSDSAGRPLPRQLTVFLPGRAEIRQATSDVLREYRVWHSGTGVTVVQLEFNRPLTAGQRIELEYAVPFDRQGDTAVPAIRLLEGERLLSHRIGLRTTAGMTVEPDRSALIPGRVQELLPDTFYAGSSEDSAWPLPDAAFSAVEATPIPFQLALLEPARKITIEQTVTIESRALRWEALAQVEVTGTPVFEHELSVPRDLRIDSLSVDQDGANRLLDWTRDRDRLVVHLREGRSGRQVLRIRGWLPLQTEGSTRFPTLQFLNAATGASELILRNASGRAVELFADAAAPALPGFAAPLSPGAASDAAVRRYAGPGPNVPVSCRIVPGSNAPNAAIPSIIPSAPSAAPQPSVPRPQSPDAARADRASGIDDNALSSSTMAASAVSLLETVVWDQGDGAALGLTAAYLPALERRLELTLDLPDGVQIAGVLDGDEPVAPISSGESSVMCVIERRPAEGIRRVAFLWRRTDPGSHGGATVSVAWPTLRNLTADLQLITVVPPHGRFYVRRAAPRLVVPEICRLERSEQLLQLIGGHADPGHGRSAAVTAELAHALDAEVASLTVVRWANDRLRARTAALAARWDSIRGAPRLAAATDARAPTASLTAVSGQFELASAALRNADAVLWQPSANDRRVEVWSIGDRAARIVGGLLCGLMLLVLWRAGRRLRRRWRALGTGPGAEYLGLALLGGVWWYALRLGGAGLVLLAIAVSLQAAAWLPRERGPASAPP